MVYKSLPTFSPFEFSADATFLQNCDGCFSTYIFFLVFWSQKSIKFKDMWALRHIHILFFFDDFVETTKSIF